MVSAKVTITAFLRVLSTLATPIETKIPSIVLIVTAESLSLPTTAFGSQIEGVSVNKRGDIFAVGYKANGATPEFSFGALFNIDAGTGNVLAPESLIFTADKPPGGQAPLLAGSRFISRGSKVLLTGENTFRELPIISICQELPFT